jgi:hypothetical protein
MMTFAAAPPRTGELAVPHVAQAICSRRAVPCGWPRVKGLTIMVNGAYNGWRMEDVWLDN